MCTGRIELCGKRGLKWLREGRSPEEPHDSIAPFGTQPRRGWTNKPSDNDQASGSEDGEQAERDAAEHREIASYMVQAMLRRIDIATESAGQEVDNSQDAGSDGGTGQLYPGVNDQARTRTVGRAY